MMTRATIEDLLRRRIGLDPASSGSGLVNRAVRARLKALGMLESERDRYLTLLNGSESELQALVEEVVVPESWFFRDEHPFVLLAERAATRWLTDRTLPPFRALSVPCAGGEEPYSIAMALLGGGLTADRFQIDAVDVSRAALETARRGVYTGTSFRSKDLSFRDRFFRATPAGYALDPVVMGTVAFHDGNVLDAGLLSDRPPYDAIFCRNLLIYLDDRARGQVLTNLDRLMSPSGLLFVGHAEHLGGSSPHFRQAGDRRCFAFERAPEGPVATTAPLPRANPRLSPRRPLAAMPAASTISWKPPAPAALEEAVRLADAGRHGEAAEHCERVIRQSGPSAPAYYLLGVVRRAGGDRDQAERCFEKAVYLDRGHEEALLALALLAQRRGDSAVAANYRRRAERASQEKSPR
jgi:chemotaxis protein methyltransferase WspC